MFSFFQTIFQKVVAVIAGTFISITSLIMPSDKIAREQVALSDQPVETGTELQDLDIEASKEDQLSSESETEAEKQQDLTNANKEISDDQSNSVLKRIQETLEQVSKNQAQILQSMTGKSDEETAFQELQTEPELKAWLQINSLSDSEIIQKKLTEPESQIPFIKFNIIARDTKSEININKFWITAYSDILLSSFRNITLLDEKGNKIGFSETISENPFPIDVDIRLNNGFSKTITMVSDVSSPSYFSEKKSVHFSLVSIVASTEIKKDLPIVGTYYHISNPPPPLAKVIATPGKTDYRTNQPYKKPGTEDYLFASVDIVSDKKVFLNSIKWWQSGSGSLSAKYDNGLPVHSNLKIYLDNIAYDISFSRGYVTASFGGIILNPGEIKNISIKGDLGEDDHTIDVNIYKPEDINITDENSNVIIPEAEYFWDYPNSGGFRKTNPWYDGYEVEIS